LTVGSRKQNGTQKLCSGLSFGWRTRQQIPRFARNDKFLACVPAERLAPRSAAHIEQKKKARRLAVLFSFVMLKAFVLGDGED
jgi:hypothetical protein